MGIFLSCCGGGGPSAATSAVNYINPDPETRRKQQAEAAEKRLHEQENRGIKDPEKIKRMQKRAQELEEAERKAGPNTGPLRWQAD